jgi:hypothetical protein
VEGGRAAVCAGDGDEKESAWRRASFHAHQHEQSRVNVPELRPVEGSRGAVCAGDGDEEAV